MEIDFRKYPFPGKRPRHHITSTIYIPFKQLKVVPKSYPLPFDEINWAKVFKNGRPPDCLDVGTGRGKFFLEFALINPSKNILGLEIKNQVVEWLNNIIKSENIPNAWVLWYNILNGLNFINDNSIEEIFCLFPDPWPKARHHKRRAINSSVLSEFYRILKPNGKIFFATDKEEVISYYTALLESFSRFSFEEINDESLWILPKTNKQISCENRGIHFFRIIATKLAII